MRVVTTLVVLLALAAAFLLLRGHEPRPMDFDEGLRRAAAPGTSEGGPRSEASGEVASPVPSVPGTRRDGSAGVLVEGVAGTVVDERERPIPSADVVLEAFDVRALKGGRPRPGVVLARTTTDRDGAFLLPLREKRWVRVVASTPGHGTVGVRVPGPGARVRLCLPPAASLEVEVLDAERDGPPGAEVEILAREALLRAPTGGDGRVRFDDLPPGTVVVRATTPDGREARGGPLAVTAGETATVRLLLGRTTHLRGRTFDAGTYAPVADAEVHVARPGRSVAAGPTGADGTFGPLPVGTAGERVLVAVRAEGYAPALVPVFLAHADEAQVVEIPLQPAAPWCGRVVDATGRAVRGARVAYTHDGIEGREPAATTTDEDGRFTLPPPPPPAPGRRVVLVAEAAVGRAARALRPGDTQPADLVLVLRGGATVSGRIVDVDGRPCNDVTIRLDPVWRLLTDRRRPGPETSRLLAMNERGRLALTTQANENGHWQIGGVPDGTYDVRILRPGATCWSDEVVEVHGGHVDLGNLHVGGGHRLEGRSTDPHGRPLAGVDVIARGEGGAARVLRTITNREGNWHFENVATGPWTIRAVLPGHLDGRLEVDVPTHEAVEVVLEPGASIRGRVLEGSRPVTGAFTVHLEAEASRAGRRGIEGSFRNADGRFDVTGVPPGAWRVLVETARGRVGTSAGPLEVRPGVTYDVTVKMRAGATVTGCLRAANGQAAAGGRVVLSDDETHRQRTVTPGADGRFRLEGLPAGTWRVRAWGPGGAPVETTVDLADGRETALDLDLGPVGTLIVTVRGSDGGARPGAYVTIRPRGGLPPVFASPPRTDRDGRVRLPDVPVGPLDIVARTQAGEEGRIETTVAEGAEDRVVVVVGRTGRR